MFTYVFSYLLSNNITMDIDTTTIVTLVGTIAATIGGKEAWSYYKKRLDAKTKIAMKGNAGETELRNEIKEMLEDQIAELKEQIKDMTVRLNEMDKEREQDKKRIAKQDKQIAILSERLGKHAIKSRGTNRGNESKDIIVDLPDGE